MDDADLVRAARAGDRAALDALIRRHRASVLRTCRRVLDNRADAEDAAQEALLQVLVALPRLREPERFAAWTRAIAANVAHRVLRRRRALDAILRSEAAFMATWPVARAGSAEDALLERERRGTLAAALADMPARAREAVVAVDLGGASYAEAAAALGVSASTVRGRLHEGRRRLRVRLADERTIRPGAPAADKEATVEDLVEVEVAGVGFARRVGEPEAAARRVVLLRERGGPRTADVPAGEAGDDVEAALGGEPAAGLAAGLVAALGATVERVVIDGAGAAAWSATVELGGGRGPVPARPGEALALAAAVGAPVACRPAAFEARAQVPAEAGREDRAAEIAALRRRAGGREPPPAAPAPLGPETESAAQAELEALCAGTGAEHALLMHSGGALVATAGDVDAGAAARYAAARGAGDEDLATLVRFEGFDPRGGALIAFREVAPGWRLELAFAGDAQPPVAPDDARISQAAARLAGLLGGP